MQYWQVPPPTHKSPLAKYEKGQWGGGGLLETMSNPQETISEKHKLELSQQPTAEGCCIRLLRQAGHSRTKLYIYSREYRSTGHAGIRTKQVLYSFYNILIHIIHDIYRQYQSLYTYCMYYARAYDVWTARELYIVTCAKWLCFNYVIVMQHDEEWWQNRKQYGMNDQCLAMNAAVLCQRQYTYVYMHAGVPCECSWGDLWQI